ncbi:Integrator complex subunit 2 [Mortierella alpina]|uniref:Integrator complex subunit 2 n=1 Tax=Mortierella alpina TaxID=64518 RepID=A0A9P6J7U8_MORAP|nr:Integrator complex subunit 2 [Mortierella alpina]
MGAAADAFRLVETGGDPRLHQNLDYTQLVPLLLARFSLASVPFLIRYPHTGLVLEYMHLDYALIQRQVKEQLQLEKQNIHREWPTQRNPFESGTSEDRARIILSELERLRRSHEEAIDSDSLQQIREHEGILANPIYRQEVEHVLAVLTLRCSHPAVNIKTLVRSLRSVRDPGPLITFIIANQPTEFLPTVDSILSSPDLFSNTKAIILRLCKLADHKTCHVRQRLVERKMFPNLALELTIEHCHDEISFMNRILQGQPEWLTSGVDPVTKTSLTSIMEFLFSSLNDELISQRPDHVAIIRLLRILSGMVGLMNLTLTSEQLEISLGVLEMSPAEPSTVDIKVCLILMCASQLLKYSGYRMERTLHKLLGCQNSPQVLLLAIYLQTQQLLKVDEFASQVLTMSIVVPRKGLTELVTLFSTLFSSEELASCALGFGRSAPTPPSSGTPTLAAAQSRLLEQDDSSSRNASELRSVSNFCVSHLLKHGVFHKSSIDVRSWVMEQIQATTVPLDANMIPLLHAYTTAISQSDRITRIPEREIRALFSQPSDDLTPAKVLLVLYMLLNNDVCLANQDSDNAERNQEYDASLLEHVQIRKVLLYVQNFQDGMAFKAVQPMFLKLVNAQFPELFDVTTLLLEEELSSSSTAALSSAPAVVSTEDSGPLERYTFGSLSESEQTLGVSLFMAHHLKALEQHIEHPDSAVKAYHTYQRLPQADRQSIAGSIIKASLPSLLDPRSNPTVMEAFKKTWDQLNSVMPHQLWSMTIQALVPEAPTGTKYPLPTLPVGASALGAKQPGTYSFEWLVQDPLLLFKVDFQVFRTPTIFRLFIQVLGAVMVGSRHWFRKKFEASQATLQRHQHRKPFQAQQAQKKWQQFKDSNLSAMLYIQDTTLIQLLLEACEARPEDRELASKDNVTDALKEIRVVTFNFLHQLFIDHKIFPKLVHFQGYSMDLLPSTVAGIESIHVCLDFLHELVTAPSPAALMSGSRAGGEPLPQVFALRLAALICERFPLPRTMQMATDFILPKLESLLVSTAFSKDVLESAKVLAIAFPSLVETIIDILRGKAFDLMVYLVSTEGPSTPL